MKRRPSVLAAIRALQHAAGLREQTPAEAQRDERRAYRLRRALWLRAPWRRP